MIHFVASAYVLTEPQFVYDFPLVDRNCILNESIGIMKVSSVILMQLTLGELLIFVSLSVPTYSHLIGVTVSHLSSNT